MWTESIEARLAVLAQAELTYTQIAAALTNEFGIKCNRMQVAGKLKRLRDTGVAPARVKPPKPKLKAKPKPEPKPKAKPKEKVRRRRIGPMEALQVVRTGDFSVCQWYGPEEGAPQCCKPIVGPRIKAVRNYCARHQIEGIRPDRRASAERILGLAS